MSTAPTSMPPQAEGTATLAMGGRVAQPRCHLQEMPDDALILVMASVASADDLVALMRCSRRLLELFRQHKTSITPRVIERVVFASNMDVAFIAFCLLRIPSDDMHVAVRALSRAVAQRPRLVVGQYLVSHDMQ